ncbi:MAG TPA: pyridoxal-dependent decarboxylase [Mycobacteriales bacterium]|nr:pyridoxal-dependent decarboxylase [Mycobacteriales bacterium]
MPRHMTPDEFRTHGRQVIDWIADYMERVESLPVLSAVEPGEIRSRLPEHPPETAEGFAGVLADLDQVLLPGITHWQHPSFFAYFPANASGPAILGDLLSSGLGVQGMLWATSPACTELEQVVLDWLAELLGLGAQFRSSGPGGGVIQDTASTATLTALLAALHRQGATEADGVRTGEFCVYGTSESHSSLEKAVRIAGLGTRAIRLVPIDPQTLAMDPAALETLIAADAAAGRIPAFVLATVGTTSTSAIDPLRAIGPIARRAGAWLHVDAAYAGVAAVCPELRWILDGVDEFADSLCTNPHKWLLTNFDCDAFWVADRAPLLAALSILPEYLRNAASESGAVVDYRDWHVQLGRRFRSLKLWSVIRWYGATGLREHIRSHVALAQEFAEWLCADTRFEIMAPHPLSLVCFRLKAGDTETTELMNRLNSSGALYLTHTKVRDKVTLRLAIGSTSTERRHVAAAWQRIQEALRE